MDFKVVFIDDNLDVNEPIVQNIRKHYQEELSQTSVGLID